MFLGSKVRRVRRADNHRPVFYLKHDVSETEFCLRFQVEPTQLDSIDVTNLCLRRQDPTE
jgi:hypothetical protein